MRALGLGYARPRVTTEHSAQGGAEAGGLTTEHAARLARAADGSAQLLFGECTPADTGRWAAFATAWVHEYDFSGSEARLVGTVPPRNEKQGHAGAELRRWGQARMLRSYPTYVP